VTRERKPAEDSADQVIEHVRRLIERGELRPGDRLQAERELAVQIGVSRPTVRVGLRALAAMGVVRTRHGAGTFVTEFPVLDSEPLSFLAALHGFTRDEMYEARRILEVGAAALAAERATPDQMTAISEEIANLFASMDDPQAFLVHDIRFHRAVAAASGNPIVASLVEMVSVVSYDQQRKTAERATGRNLRDAAEMHRRVYQAIRSRNPEEARGAMNEHLLTSRAYQAEEEHSGRGSTSAALTSPADDRRSDLPRS